jgi:uncharacterized membrane protein YdjX (TVP38/TMEM64 family)
MTEIDSNPRLNRIIRILLFLVIAVGVTLVIKNWQLVHPSAVQEWVNSVGVLGPLFFILLFGIAAVLFIPATVMVLAGGALFGPVLGTIYNICGASVGAVLAFVLSRYLVSEWAQRRTGSRLKFIMDGVRDEGWKFVALVRIAGVPYFVLNWALGLTPIRLLPYTLATIVGVAPSTAAITYAGYVGFEAFEGNEGLTGKLVTALALVAVMILIPIILRIIRGRSGKTG